MFFKEIKNILLQRKVDEIKYFQIKSIQMKPAKLLMFELDTCNN